MLRSMFAGVSGLRSHQTMMDVTGNNISNVNTFGYKSTRATFQDLVYQAVRGATGGVQDDTGGVNPMQIGLGSRVASIDGNFTQGAMQLTGRSTDIALQGEGYFVVNNGEGDRYTRAGAFRFDNAGNFVDPNGAIVQGWASTDDDADGDGIADDGTVATAPDNTAAVGNIFISTDLLQAMQNISVNADGEVVGRDAAGTEIVLAQVALATFVSEDGLERVGDSMFAETANSGVPDVGVARTGNRGATQGGTLEMSNVDLAQEFTQLIMAQRGFQANARTITTSDEVLAELVNIKR